VVTAEGGRVELGEQVIVEATGAGRRLDARIDTGRPQDPASLVALLGPMLDA
jgi:hypothetical protein